MNMQMVKAVVCVTVFIGLVANVIISNMRLYDCKLELNMHLDEESKNTELIKRLSNRIHLLSSEVTCVSNKNVKLIDEHAKELSWLNDQLADARDHSFEAHAIAALENEVKDLKKQLEHSKNKLNGLSSEYSMLQAENCQLRNDLSNCKTENLKIKNHINFQQQSVGEHLKKPRYHDARNYKSKLRLRSPGR